MNFIESYFGVSPDGGDGSLEILFFVLVIMIGAAIGLHLPIVGKATDDIREREKRH